MIDELLGDAVVSISERIDARSVVSFLFDVVIAIIIHTSCFFLFGVYYT